MTPQSDGIILRLKRQLSFLFELDPRNLGLFRMIFGALCLSDLWLRLPHIQMMYASSGWMPSHRVLWTVSTQGEEAAHPFSLLYLFNTTPMITLFFYAAMLCVFCFMIGYRTRLFQILSGLCMISVHTRTNVLHNGGDIVHNLWWMWAIWLPLGQSFSVDSLRQSLRTPDPDDATLNRPRLRDTKPLYSVVVFGILMNLSFCYFLNGVHKNSADWMNGSAVPYVLEQDRILTTLGALSREYIPLWGLKGLSWLTLIAESTAPLFLILPLLSRKAHLLTLSAISIFYFQMLSRAPFTLSLITLSLLALSLIAKRFKALLAEIVHIFSIWVISTLMFLHPFPLWLASIVGGSYALGAFLLFRLPEETRVTWSRRVVLLGLGGFHISAGLTMNLGFFSWWMMACYFLLLRTEDWEWMIRVFKPRSAPIIVSYPKGDELNYTWVRIGARLDRESLITWQGSQEDQGLIVRQTESNLEWTGSSAVAQITRRIPLLLPLAWLISIKVIGRPLLALSRWASKLFFSPSPSEAISLHHQSSPASELFERSRRPFGELGAAFCFVIALTTVIQGNNHFRNRHSLRLDGELKQVATSISKGIDEGIKSASPSLRSIYQRAWRPRLPDWMSSFVTYGNFYQGWGMFTNVPKEDGWMIFEVTLSDGRVLDMRTGAPPSYDVANFKNRSWGFYEARFGLKLLQRPNLRPLVASWASRQIPRMRLKAEDQVDELKLYWVADQTQAPITGGPRPPLFKEKKLIHEWKRNENK